MIKTTITTTLTIVTLFIVPLAYAQKPGPGLVDLRGAINKEGTYVPLGEGAQSGDALGGIIGAIVNLAIIIAAVAVILYLIWGGYAWLTSGGDKVRVEEARNRITNAIIGLAIVASALAISFVVNQFFGTSVDIQGVGL